jgi:hypothetical protein
MPFEDNLVNIMYNLITFETPPRNELYGIRTETETLATHVIDHGYTNTTTHQVRYRTP